MLCGLWTEDGEKSLRENRKEPTEILRARELARVKPRQGCNRDGEWHGNLSHLWIGPSLNHEACPVQPWVYLHSPHSASFHPPSPSSFRLPRMSRCWHSRGWVSPFWNLKRLESHKAHRPQLNFSLMGFSALVGLAQVSLQMYETLYDFPLEGLCWEG